MIVTDIVLLASLLVYLICWWQRGMNNRYLLLLVSALIALAAGVFGSFDHRWQNAVGAAAALILLVFLLVAQARTVSWKTPWISSSFVLLLVLLSALPIYFFPVPDLPEPSGRYPVGVADFELSDPDRPGLLEAKDHQPRRLLVRVWYPASKVTGLSPRPYFTEQETKHTATGLGRIFKMPFLYQYLKHVGTNSFEGAPLLSTSDSLPVLMYSHGYTSFAGQNTALMEHLASHGYIVYSVQHPYDGSPTVFPNGEVLDISPELLQTPTENAVSDSMKKAFGGNTLDERYQGQVAQYQESLDKGDRIASQSAQVWLGDRQFVLDALAEGLVPENVSAIVAAGDLRRTGQMGMSFGGSTTGALCMVDRRCAAGINLDGGDYHRQPFGRNIPVPFMMFYSDYRKITEMLGMESTLTRGFNDFSYERHELAGARQDVYRLMVNDVAHLGVSDFTLFIRNPLRAPLFGSIDADAMIEIQNLFVRGFFDTHLRGMDVGFPQRLYQQYDEWVQPNSIADIATWWVLAHPQDRTERVVLETELGEIEVALYPNRSPLAVAQFLSYVDNGHYDGASFYRATYHQRGDAIDVVQGGLLAHTMSQPEDSYAGAELPFDPIAHETTSQTGISNERGTLSFARLAPGTANSEFFFNLEDNPELDTGNTSRNPDGQGYTTFGRVIRGLPILDKIQTLPTDGPAEIELVKGQILTEPVKILRAYRP